MSELKMISDLAKAISKTGESIELLVNNAASVAGKSEEVSDLYFAMILDELSHAQRIILSLTSLLAPEEADHEEDEPERALRIKSIPVKSNKTKKQQRPPPQSDGTK